MNRALKLHQSRSNMIHYEHIIQLNNTNECAYISLLVQPVIVQILELCRLNYSNDEAKRKFNKTSNIDYKVTDKEHLQKIRRQLLTCHDVTRHREQQPTQNELDREYRNSSMAHF